MIYRTVPRLVGSLQEIGNAAGEESCTRCDQGEDRASAGAPDTSSPSIGPRSRRTLSGYAEAGVLPLMNPRGRARTGLTLYPAVAGVASEALAGRAKAGLGPGVAQRDILREPVNGSTTSTNGNRLKSVSRV